MGGNVDILTHCTPLTLNFLETSFFLVQVVIVDNIENAIWVETSIF